MKRLFLLFAAFSIVASTMAASFTKVTSAPSSWEGEYLLAAMDAGNNALVWTGVDAGQCRTSVAVNDNVITSDSAITITVEALAQGYSIRVNGGVYDGKYLSSGPSAPTYTNGLKFVTTPTRVDFAFNMDETVVMYQAIDSINRVYLLYNRKTGSDNERFRFYKGYNYGGANFQTPCLFKKDGSGDSPDTNPIFTVAEVKTLSDSAAVRMSGVVTHTYNKNAWIQDATGGMLLFFSNAPDLSVGDEVILTGEKTTYAGAPEVQYCVIEELVASGQEVSPVNYASIAEACQERNMFTSVHLQNLEIVGFGSYSNPYVSDGTDTLLCYRMTVDTTTYRVGTRVNLTAVLNYYNGYQFVGDVAGIQVVPTDTVPSEQPTSVTFNVIVPENTPDCYIVGNFNGWTHQQMTKLTDSTYTYVYSAVNLIIDSLKYKYCAGPDWAYVEKEANGDDVLNRSWQAQDIVATWAAVPEDTVPEQPTVPTIAQVKALDDNTETQVSGVVTFISGRNVYIQDATGGLLLYMSATPTFAAGDQVVVSGVKTTYRGAPELSSVTEVSADAGTMPEPTSFMHISEALSDESLFTLVHFNNLEIVSLNSYNYPSVTDGIDTLLCYRMAVDPTIYPIGTHVNLTAILGYYNGYQFVGDVAGIQVVPTDTVPSEQPTSVTFNVIVPENTPDCYIVGNFNGWTHQQMTKLTDSTYTYVYSAVNLIIDSLAYTYCAGNSWAYGETDSLGSEIIPTRRWQALDRVVAWLAVPGDSLPQDTVPEQPTVPTIAQVKALDDNTETQVSGVVTFINGRQVYVQDATGGLLLYINAKPTFNEGDKVVVSGMKFMYGGAPELKNGVEVSAVADSIPAAASFATLADACQEANMFTLVNVNNLEIVSLDSYNNPTVSDGTTTLLCYRMVVDTAVFKVGTHVDVTAVLGYYDGYQFVGDAAGIQVVPTDTVPSEQPTSVTFNVIVPENTPDCYIVGNFNGWTHQQMTKLTDSTYTFIYSNGNVDLDSIAYKYCAGPDWAYVERDADGDERPSRRWQAQDRVATWLAIPQDTIPGELPTSVTFHVLVPDNTPTCYIAGNFNNWTLQQMTMVSATSYTLTIDSVLPSMLEYKYCAGNGWEYVEVDADGSHVMNRSWQALDSVAAWFAVPGDTLPQDTVPSEQPTSVTFHVLVPDNTPACYIAGNFNNWTHQQMTMVSATSYTLTIDSVLPSMLEYKYCAGPDWEYVEVDADGYDVLNRRWQALDSVAAWLAVPGDSLPQDTVPGEQPTVPTIAQVKALDDNTETEVAGVVTFINGKQVYVQDATGGLLLYMNAKPTFNVGDKVVVSGMKAMYHGAPELSSVTEVSAEAGTMPEPTSFMHISEALSDESLFTLVHFNNLEIVSLESHNYPSVTDGIDTLLCYYMAVDPTIYPIGTHVNLTAILGYYDGYQFVGDAAGFELAAQSSADSVIFHVIVPANTPDCYIAGSFNDWTHQQMTKLSDSTYTYVYSAVNLVVDSLEYKYCAGPGWAYVEKDAEGLDVPNRKWQPLDTVVAWENTRLVHNGLHYEITSMNTVSVIPASDNEGNGNYLWLTDVVIPDTVVFNNTTYQVTGIASQAFYGCTSMTTLEVGENIEQVGMAAFYACSNLSSVVWSAKNCSEISDENSVYAFFNRISPITDFRFGTSVETIPSGLCGFLEQLTTITIPTGVKSINRYAFYGCSSLATVNLPGTLESIGYGTFIECASLTKTNFTGNLKQWCEMFIDSEGSPISYSRNLYINDVLLTHADIPEGTTMVNDYAFANDTCLISAKVPNSVEYIGLYAFNNCTNIRSIEVGNGVTDLVSIDGQNYAFSNCPKLKKFVYNSTMAEDLYVDYLYTSLELDTLIVPAQVLIDADLNFTDASLIPSHIRYLEVIDGELSSSNLQFIGFSAASLQTLNLAAASNTTLEDKAFYEYYNLTTLSLPENLQTIPYKLVADCYMLSSISIPSSVTSIGNNAFENCRSLTSVDFGEMSALQTIGNWAFYNCHNLPTLTLPEGVTAVGDGAFYGCSYLTELTIPSSMLAMGDNSFALCSKLQKMNVNAAIPPAIESKTFKDVLRTIPVRVPQESVELYKTDTYWKEFFIIGSNDSETGIEDTAADEATQPTKIIRDGHVLIRRGDNWYDVVGNVVE